MEVINIVLDFLRTDIFTSFGLLTIPFLIGRQIPKLKENFLKIDEMACRLIIFCGILYTIILLISYSYIFIFMGDENNEYAITNRATGSYAWAYWAMIFSWLFITQPFRFKLVRKNILIRLLSIPFFLITLEQYVIFTTSLHRDYGSESSSDFHLLDILDTIPYWPLHLLLKLGLFIGYVFLFQWISKKIKRNKVVS
ncbi:hypothetical protein ACFO3O_12475 [Dokdonia ponticola]|uniref:Uncharacterized protein n=1 Tax=Dokdonia ponticola TaxID=2041041 RepID=A0ABV9I0D7_9FLAO